MRTAVYLAALLGALQIAPAPRVGAGAGRCDGGPAGAGRLHRARRPVRRRGQPDHAHGGRDPGDPARLHRPPPRPGPGPGGALRLRAEAVGGARRPEVERGRPDLRQRGADRLARRPGPAARGTPLAQPQHGAPHPGRARSPRRPRRRTGRPPSRAVRGDAARPRAGSHTDAAQGHGDAGPGLHRRVRGRRACRSRRHGAPPAGSRVESRTRCSSRATPRCSSSKRRRRRAGSAWPSRGMPATRSRFSASSAKATTPAKATRRSASGTTQTSRWATRCRWQSSKAART